MPGAPADGWAPEAAEADFAVLVFSKTAGFRHDSIPTGITAIQQLGAQNGFTVEATEDAGAFTDTNLDRFDAVVWLSTTGDVLNAEQQSAFERYITDGGGYAGVHAASDTEYDWSWYGDLVGAYFDSHPQIQEAGIDVEDHVHPSTVDLPERWTRTDEWYNYQQNPREDVHVLATLDETSYDPGSSAMGDDHPIAWCQDFQGGRSWYTGGGHTTESYSEPEFLGHLLGGIRTAAGAEDADCSAEGGGDPTEPPADGDFEQVTLARGAEVTGEPMAMAVLPDGQVVHTSRDGRVWLTTPQATTTLAGTIPVYNHDEDGLQGVAVDPDFATNRWVYLYYAPPLDTPTGDAPENGTGPETFEPWKGHNQLSRFTLTDAGTLDPATEQQILQVPADRGICCHAGGEIDFDADGNLYLSTGDDTNPFASQGYTPIDDRSTRNPAFDARRTAGNTNDLRGKVIRIAVTEDGSYTIPEGNMFAPGSEDTRPEIYAMGFRNPFRFAVDDATGDIFLGEYGPDAGTADPNRGPGGIVEFNRITEPGNFGWPLCVGDNVPFRDYDFGSGASGPAFDCANPVNDSPNNTGLTELPPAQAAWIPYDGGSVPAFGNGSESPMGGPAYRYDADLASDTKFPEYFDGLAFLHEWERSWIKTVDPEVGVDSVESFFDSMELTRPMNLEFGPDGSLYVLDYGSGYFGGAEDSALYRIDYTQGQRSPVVRVTADPSSGAAPLPVRFDPAGTTDPDGGELSYAWDFDGDAAVDSTEAGPVEYTYTEPGAYTARLEVTNPAGRSAAASITVTVGNTAPQVELRTPVDGGVFSFGDTVPFEVVVTDPEDSATEAGIDCERVVVEYILGHDTHGHPLSRATGCSGVLQTVADGGHGADANIFGVINATYTDGGAGDVPVLTGDDEAVLRQRAQQAEFYTGSQGVRVVDQADASGGRRVGYIEPADWISFDPTNLANVTGIGYRYSSGGAGGTVEVRSGAVDGPLVQTVTLPPTGGFDTYAELPPAPITDPGGTSELFFVFSGTGEGGLFDLDMIRFDGRGVSDNAAPQVSATATPVSGAAPLEVAFAATGSDPDGEELTYTWDFGDGSTGEGAEATHTYTEVGNYTATVIATDPRGATGRATVAITVGRDVGCENPDDPVEPDDEFLGAGLDGCRWDVTRYDPSGLRVVDGVLQIDTTDADIYATPNQDVPNIVTQPQPDGDWTVETSLRGTIDQPYQQGGLIVYGGDGDYVKLDVLATADGVLGAELRSEIGDVVQNPQPSIGDISSTSGDYRLRLAKAGDTYSGEMSLDGGESWQALPETVTNAAVSDAGVGVYALGKGQTESTTLSFDYVRFTGGTGPPACEPTVPEQGYRSLFDGTADSAAAWRQSGPGEFVLQDDCTLLTTGGLGMLWFPEEFGAYSLRLDWKLAGDDNSGVFVGFPDPGDDPFVAVNQGYEIQIDATDAPDRTTGSIYTFQAADIEARDAALNPPGKWNGYEIRIEGQTITVLLNDVVINEFTSTDPNRDLTQGFVGLQNHGNGDDVSFRNVRIMELDDQDTVAPTVTAATDPAAPDGAAGWFRTGPTVTLSATDDVTPAPDVAIEYRLDGGEWTAYSQPVAVTGDGERVLEHRATDAAGNVSEVGTLAVPVDGTAPLSTSAFADPGPDGSATGTVEVAVEATDATSGVALLEYALDGGPWTPYTEPVQVSGDGQHTVAHRATDVAGNVETEKAATIAIDATAPTLLVSGVADGAVYGDATDIAVSWEATDDTSGVASVRGALDGARLNSGSLVALHTMPLGTHTLRAVATDEAGNRTVQTVRFASTTSLRDMQQLIDRFRATNRLSLTATSRLTEALTEVRQAEASGDDLLALQELTEFRELAGDTTLVREVAVRSVLQRDADAVYAQIDGG